MIQASTDRPDPAIKALTVRPPTLDPQILTISAITALLVALGYFGIV